MSKDSEANGFEAAVHSPLPLSPRTVVLTGMSGAGKQLAARCFEDMCWRVVDNLPPPLLPLLIDEAQEQNNRQAGVDGADADGLENLSLCLVCDVRGGRIAELLPALDTLTAGHSTQEPHAAPVSARLPLRSAPTKPTLLFLDASDAELIHRFKETRRTHPLFLSANGILPAIARERDLLSTIKERADIVLDTTGLSPVALREALEDIFGARSEIAPHRYPLTVTVASFGFKHGTPLDADLMFDVRFLRNPHYVEALRPRDGRDPEVEAFVMGDERTDAFLERLYDLVGWSLPHYVSEGKAYLTIAIGCTGGRHRSVVVAEKLGRFVADRGYRVLVQHRDAVRDKGRDAAVLRAADQTTQLMPAAAASLVPTGEA